MRVKANPYLLLTLTSLFWAGNFVLGRAVNINISPISLAFWRWALALAILMPFSLTHVRSQWPLIRKNFLLLTVYGVLGVSCFNTFVYTGLHSTTATNALLLNSIIPILIVLLSRLLAAATISRRQAVGIAVSLTGVLVIVCRASLDVILTLQVNSGDVWILAAAVSWAFYTYLLRKRPPDFHPLSFLTSVVSIGLIPLALLYFLELGRGSRFALDPANIASILYVAVFPSVLAFIFWNQAVREVGPDRAGLFLYLMPVFGAVLSAAFLGESIRVYHLIGTVLIFTGIHLTTRTPAKVKVSGQAGASLLKTML